MASITGDEVTHAIPLLGIKVFKDGRVERLIGTEIVPASVHPETGVQSKDVTVDPETGLSARLYLPKITNPDQKLPLLVYFHGGGFCIESAFSILYHTHLNSLAAEAKTVVVSVEYRRVPEHPLPIAYEDSWASLKWISSHASGGNGGEDWLRNHVDFARVFFAGDSAGANIAHHMGIRVGCNGLPGLNLVGVVLVHPYFWRKLPDGSGEALDRLWLSICPTSSGSDDPWINPENDPKLSSLACKKLLVCVAEQDTLNAIGKYYCEVLKKSGWGGAVDIFEDEGDHVYHLFKPTSEKGVALLKKVASFLNQ